MARIIRVEIDGEGGIAPDTVETLLSKTVAGEELAVFADDGTIVFVHENHEFEEA